MSGTLQTALDEIETARHALTPKQHTLVKALSKLQPSSSEQLMAAWYLLPAYAADSFPVPTESWSPPMALSIANRTLVSAWPSSNVVLYLVILQLSPGTAPMAYYSAQVTSGVLSGSINIQSYDLESITLSNDQVTISISDHQLEFSHAGESYINNAGWIPLENRHSWIMSQAEAVSVWRRTNPGALPDKFFLQILVGASRMFSKPRVETRFPCWELEAGNASLKLTTSTGTYSLGQSKLGDQTKVSSFLLPAPWGGTIEIGLYQFQTGIRLTCKSRARYSDCLQAAIKTAGASSSADAMMPQLTGWESAPSFLLSFLFFGLPMLILMVLSLLWIRERWPSGARYGIRK